MIYIEFLYILKTFILNKCFAVISLILKLKTAGIYAQSLTEIQDLIKPNSTENCETKLFQNFLGLFIFLRLLQVFHDRMNPDCDDRVWLSKSDKNIGAGGWWVGNIFEAAYSGDVSSAHHYREHTPGAMGSHLCCSSLTRCGLV